MNHYNQFNFLSFIQRFLNLNKFYDMSTLSSSSHKLFINFCGQDIRYGFVSHLIDTLERHNINFFIDTHEQKGRDLKHLFKRIEEATISLVILSTRYAKSIWCLEELRAIMEQAEKGKMIVIPIFYKVRQADVRRQKEEFGYYFWKRSGKSSLEEMEKWQTALKAVSNKIGLTLDHNRSEAKFIKKVVKVLAAIPSDERREEYDCVKTYNVPSLVAMALSWAWFGSAVGLIGAVLLGFGLIK